MAFNFLGTFTTGQFDRLKQFAKIQELDISERIKTLQKRLNDNGKFTTIFDEYSGYPAKYIVSPVDSYGAKLLSAYKALGGNPEKDFIIRTMDKPVFLTRDPGDDGGGKGYSTVYSNGRVDRGKNSFDKPIGTLVNNFKSWQLESIKYKRERLEYKIKRCMDMSDQIESEIKILTLMLSEENNVMSQVMDIINSTDQYGSGIIHNLDDLFGYEIGRIVASGGPLQDDDSSESEANRELF